MADLPQITEFMDAIMLPFIGCVALMVAKFADGEAAPWAERQFFAVLLVVTLVTLRTVITCDEVWLVHTATLGSMVVGALVIPGQDTSVVM
jgi:hypothetical protein